MLPVHQLGGSTRETVGAVCAEAIAAASTIHEATLTNTKKPCLLLVIFRGSLPNLLNKLILFIVSRRSRHPTIQPGQFSKTLGQNIFNRVRLEPPLPITLGAVGQIHTRLVAQPE